MKKITSENTCVIFIDIQEKFRKIILGMNKVLEKILILAKTAKILQLPFIVLEQCPKGLGQTFRELLEVLKPEVIIAKTTFSGYMELNFIEKLKKLNRPNLIICGLETHICVLQTVFDLMIDKYRIFVAGDATSSRHLVDKELALMTMRDKGATVISTEAILFMLISEAKHPHFKAIHSLIK